MNSAGLIGDGYLPSWAAPGSSMGLLKKAALTHSRPRPRGAPCFWQIYAALFISRPRPRGAPLPIGNPPPESQVAPVRVWSACPIGQSQSVALSRARARVERLDVRFC